MEVSNVNKLVKSTVWVYIGKIGIQILSFITSILVIRKLNIEMYGTYQLLLNIIFLFNVFSASPVINIFTRYIPELLNTHNHKKIWRLIRVGSSIVGFVTSILVLLIHLFRDQFADFLNVPDFSNYQLALCVYILLMLARQLISAVLTSCLLHKQLNIYLVLSSFTRSILLIVLLSRINVNLILYIEAVSTAVYVIPAFIYLTRYLASLKLINEGETDTPVTRKRIMKYGMYSSFNELGAGLVGKTSDFFIVSAMSNLHFVGFYSFANKVSELMYRLLPHQEFMTVIRPLFIQKFTKEHEEEEFNKLYNFMVKVMIPVFVIPVVYFIVFGRSVIEYVFDPKYLDAYYLCVLILSANIYYAIFFPVSMVIRLRERMDISFKSKIVVVFSIVGGIYAMKHYGIHGLAAVTVLGDLLKNLYMYFSIRREVDIRYHFNEMKNYILIFALVGGAMYFIQKVEMNFLILVVESFIFLALLGVMMIRYHVFSNHDMQYLNKIGTSNKHLSKLRKVILLIHQFGRKPIRNS